MGKTDLGQTTIRNTNAKRDWGGVTLHRQYNQSQTAPSSSQPFCNTISITPSPPLEPGFAVVLVFERKNRGAVFESVHSATDTVSSLPFEGIVNEGGFGSVSVLKEATALRDNCCRVCVWTMAVVVGGRRG